MKGERMESEPMKSSVVAPSADTVRLLAEWAVATREKAEEARVAGAEGSENAVNGRRACGAFDWLLALLQEQIWERPAEFIPEMAVELDQELRGILDEGIAEG